MGETIVQRIKRVAMEEVSGYLLIILLMFLVIALVFISLPIVEILREPVLLVMEGIAISGWILAMILNRYPFLIIVLLLALLVAVLLIRKYRITYRRSFG